MKRFFALCALVVAPLCAGAQTLTETFDNPSLALTTVGRGENTIAGGVLTSRDAYVTFGEADWRDYEFTFRARAPKGSERVQIWGGFRAANRYDRYIFGLKGGSNQNDLYLSRMGYMGTDEFLGLRDLDFRPEAGVWYDFRVQVCGARIRIFLNGESLPRIDVTDSNSQLAPSGPVTLGGAWLATEFDDLKVTPLAPDALAGVPATEYIFGLTAEHKSQKRKAQRAAYKPVKVSALKSDRTEVSLDGDWLFMPDHEMAVGTRAASPETSDEGWHVMNVPDFWNPSHIWLHGEVWGRKQFAKGASDTYYQGETDRCENFTFDYKKTSVGWYRHWVELPAGIETKHTEFVFDAISKVAEVWVNGHAAGSNVGMFGEVRIDATGFLKPGRNLVCVKVMRDYIEGIDDPNKVLDVSVTVPITNAMTKDIAHGFWSDSPAGIWQPTKIVITEPVRIEDVYIIPSTQGARFEVTVKNHDTKSRNIDLVTRIADHTDGAVIHLGVAPTGVRLAAGEERVLEFSVDNIAPKLWTPHHPNLYDFTFSLVEGRRTRDTFTEVSGFRTFEARDGFLWLNGVKYALRGGNHTPFALAPNSRELADKFYGLMKEAGIDATRTHTTPYNKLWMRAADENGIGISFEGTWPWLMIHETFPERRLISMWADEWLDLMKKYRNHPSLLFWTVNNEMKFYDNEPDLEIAKTKMRIISDVVKRMRVVDPTRPVSFDSNYRRTPRFDKAFYDEIDDGDIDDVHGYFNWYDHSVFRYFRGQFQTDNLNPGRPLISQEMSTGYPNSETGHATRHYNLVHHNPQSLIGHNSYEFGDPAMFLDVHSFITGELAEALRRSGDRYSGTLHFALLTWFRNIYDPRTIEPFPTYWAMKRALAPVLVSAELWGRNFYAGGRLPARFCIVNDREDGAALAPSTVSWSVEDAGGRTIASGEQSMPAVEHAQRQWATPEITLPSTLPVPYGEYVFRLVLSSGGEQLAVNEYKIKIADRQWTQVAPGSRKIVVADFDGISPVLDAVGVRYTRAADIAAMLRTRADLYIVSGWKPKVGEVAQVRKALAAGARVLVLNADGAAHELYPDYITGHITPGERDIVNLEIPENAIFNGLGTLDLRYFNNEQAGIPTVCHSALQVVRDPRVVPLAMHIRIHGYIDGEMEERSAKLHGMKGFPIVRIDDGRGVALLSTMTLEKGATDPVAARLLANMIESMGQ